METIICIIGPSGSGKTYMAEYLHREYGIKMIESRTTRKPRTPDEVGHTFVSDEEFDTYSKGDMLAYTQFGNNRYCCLKNDITEDVMSYVIDEYGLRYLIKHFGDIYYLISVRIIPDETIRMKKVDAERYSRDKNKFRMKMHQFDHTIINDYTNFEHSIDKLMLKLAII